MKVTLNTKIEKKPDIGKLVKRRFNKKDFVEMMALANKYPLSVRIAAELFRGNVTGKRFLDEFHIEGNSFSMQILDSITKFDLKKGYDPKGIPPVLPVYTQYVGPTQAKTLKKGRPTTEEARAFLEKMLDDCLKRGWDEVDFINNLREMVDSDTGARKVNVKFDDDELDGKKSKVKIERAYFCRINKKWVRFKTLMESEKAMKSDDNKVLGPVEFPENKVHCSYCKFRLDGVVVSTRNGKSIDHMHMGCYWMEVAHPSQIPVGMTVLSAPEGVYYEYLGKDKGGWQKKVTNEKVNPATEGSQGIPAPSGEENKPSGALPTPTKA